MTELLLFLIAIGAVYFTRRIQALERRVGTLERGHVPGQSRDVATEATPTPVAPQPAPRPRPATTPAAPKPQPRPAAPRAPRARVQLPSIDLFGAKALAFAGGVVTLLGVVFFFVLAVNRGWIGPELRVACGGIASAVVFGGGMWLYRRYGRTYSALAAVGVGIAGAYTTLLAAVSLYDLISKPVALVAAGAIASVGLAVSLAWSEEIVAGFGLIGAMVVPATLVFQGGLQEIGTAFVAVVFAAAGVVAVRERWWKLLQAALLVSVPQALAQIGQTSTAHGSIVTLALAFWLLYLAAGVAFQLRTGVALRSAPASFLTGGAVFAGVSAALLFDGTNEGIALLVVSAVYLALASALFVPRRELSLLLGALGLTATAVGVAQLLSGSSVTYAWAAEAALLAWLTGRVRDSRFQLPALAYLALALVHVLAFEANPVNFFTDVRHPATGAPALAAVALAALAFALVKRSWEHSAPQGIMRALEPALAWLERRERAVSAAAYAVAAATAVYAASLCVLELFGFQNGQLIITCIWAVAGLAAVVRWRLAFAWLAVVAAKAAVFDVLELTHTRSGISLAVVAGTLLAAGLVTRVLFAAVASMPFAVAGALVLVPGHDGLVLISVGALYTVLAAIRFRMRDLATVLWILGLTVAGYGEAIAFAGVWLVLAYTATAASVGVVAKLARERRLHAASLVYLIAAALVTLVGEAPPSHLVMPMAHPGDGLASLVLLVIATATFAWSLDWSDRFRAAATWAAGALGVYSASLAILEAAQRLSPVDVHTNFQRGQTMVSALWGILALLSLYLGLRQGRPLVRGGGFVLFAVSLGKIFLFDLPSLSSAQRALSFLAVGAVLLLGGFFYQRLSAQYDAR